MWTYLLVIAFVVSVEVSISFNSVLLPNIKEHFSITYQLAQASISIGLGAIGVSGIFYGGLSDSFGRRPMFLLSIFLFSLGSLLCTFAPSAPLFLLARLIQGVGAGAGWIVGNAALSDLYHGRDYLDVMNRVHAVAGITPAVAPVLGSALATAYGWQNCFFLLFILSLLSGFLMLWKMPESLQSIRPFRLDTAIKSYIKLFYSPIFRHYLTIKSLAVMLLFVEVANAPLIFINYFHLSPAFYSFSVLLLFVSYLVGNLLCKPLLSRYKVDMLLEKGLLILWLSSLCLFFIALTLPKLWVIQYLLRMPIYFAWGMIFGNATAQVVKSVPGSEGVSSASMISMEMLLSSIAIWFLGLFFDGTYIAIMLFFSVVALSLYYLQKQKVNRAV